MMRWTTIVKCDGKVFEPKALHKNDGIFLIINPVPNRKILTEKMLWEADGVIKKGKKNLNITNAVCEFVKNSQKRFSDEKIPKILAAKNTSSRLSYSFCVCVCVSACTVITRFMFKNNFFEVSTRLDLMWNENVQRSLELISQNSLPITFPVVVLFKLIWTIKNAA